MRKAVRVWRHEAGNEISVGKMGEYHHLYVVSITELREPMNILDVVPYDGVGEFGEGCCGLGPKV